uniref:RHS repeat domain-containing protein n=1 Tax=uncultured Desulfuromusa sp. TaxID=219183 RepID=UPI002AA89126
HHQLRLRRSLSTHQCRTTPRPQHSLMKPTTTTATATASATAASTGPISYNPNNELTSHSTVSYEYDNNGNTTKKTEGTGSQGVPVPLVTTYHYNAKNRLTQVDLPDGRTATYSYDPFGRRISKTIGDDNHLLSLCR